MQWRWRQRISKWRNMAAAGNGEHPSAAKIMASAGESVSRMASGSSISKKQRGVNRKMAKMS
jgi:hypothetical protein